MSNDLKDFLLKECYDIAERYEPMEIPKMILREKSKNIDIEKDFLPPGSPLDSNNSYMQRVSEITYALSMEALNSAISGDFPLIHMLNSIPDCAEKYYIYALLELRKGTNEDQRTSALDYLISALDEEPNDPRFLALAQIIRESYKG